MLNPRLAYKRGTKQGFALPTVLISSIVMLIVLLTSVSATTSVRVALDEQYYTKLAQEAAEAGQARASACLEEINYVASESWDDTTRLRPDTDCKGLNISGGNRYVAQSNNIRTTFVVWAPVIGSSTSAMVTVVGTTELLRTSTQSVHQIYTHTLVSQSRYVSAPKIAGGAGWKGAGHLSVVLSTDSKVYGFGANNLGQLTDTSSPASVLSPRLITLPPGVTSATDLVTSGQGGSFMCIMANTAQAWCRGAPGASEDGLMPTAVGWHRFGLPAGLTAVSMSVSGFGSDAMCVLASDNQAYCAGENVYGTLGINDLTSSIYKIGSPQRFRLDIPAPGASLRKIYNMGDVTCGITTTDDMYCAGINSSGQIAGPSTSGTGNGTYAAPIRYPIPGARKVDDVSAMYHNNLIVHALATDGTIWSSGNYVDGALGNGVTTGSTGSSQSPALFTHANATYATGSIFWNAQSSKCIDNDNNNPTNGNIIHLWSCGSTGNNTQTWVHGKNKQLTNMGTGKCLDVPGNSSTAVNLQLYTCNNTPAQQFDLVGGNTIRHTSSGLCVDALNNGTVNGTRLQTQTCGAGNGAQSFTTYQGINGWRGMITGRDHFCGIRSDQWSGMWCAGLNNYGQLANVASGGGAFMGACENAPAGGHNIFNVNLPNNEKVDITKLSNEWNMQFYSTMVISTTGKVYGSGRNEFGKLGNGTLGDAGNGYRECTVKEFILPAGVTAVNLSTRDEFTTYVLGSDGRIYVAGRNNLGQIGDGTTTNRLAPVEVKIPRQSTVY